MMEKPEGLTGETIFAVKDAQLGEVRRPYYSLDDLTLLPATVNVRVEHCTDERETVDHKKISDYLDFGITSQVWNPSRARVVFPHAGLISLSTILHPFTPALIVRLNALAQYHRNTMFDYCMHQAPPLGPRGRRPEPCERTGYTYGSQWLVQPLPADFLPRLREIFADTDPDCVYDSGKDS